MTTPQPNEAIPAAKLRKGDRLVCLRDGEVETVLFNRKGAQPVGEAARRFVRTDRHDHLLRPDTVVERKPHDKETKT